MTISSDPHDAFARWYAEAEQHEPSVPDAMSLATVGPDGFPRVRTVLLKGFDANGFVFFTNYQSRKGQHLAEHPQASLCFHWKSLERQVLVQGTVARLAGEKSDAYWASRPRGSQLGGWASQQSRPVDSRDSLESAYDNVEAKFQGAPVPRPPHWGGFLLTPTRIEFWQGQANRFHDRIEFVLGPKGWNAQRLQP
ncbi:MAG: pyridoxamine 5'-phosphate oxidase [Myxococcales bacterium]|nr:pyridoxamine 5'-phosphate oxidase [Myxococcales bacterium]